MCASVGEKLMLVAARNHLHNVSEVLLPCAGIYVLLAHKARAKTFFNFLFLISDNKSFFTR